MNSEKRTSSEHRIALVVAHMDLVCAERNYAHNRATALEKQVAELQAEVARLKANVGCAREQRSTQYCAEVLGRDKRIVELERKNNQLRAKVAELEQDKARLELEAQQ